MPFRATSLAPDARPLVARLLAPALALTLVGCGQVTAGDGDTFDVADADGEPGRADFRYVIPAGTGEAIDEGEPVEIIPADLTVAVGDVLELVNEDDRGHIVGPFFVGANETLRQEFTAPGVYEGVCTVHPSGQVVLTVEEA